MRLARSPLIVLAVASALALVATACSSSSSDGATTDAGGAGDTAGGPVDRDNCVAPGTKPNEKGIGGYCTPGGHQCDSAGPGGAPRICTADVPDTPVHAWFCTYPCSGDAECGTDAYCASDPRGKGCVPLACKKLQDAGAGDVGGADVTPG